MSTNALGLRSPEVPPLKGPGKRILILGDSFIFGIGIEENQTIPGRLRTASSPSKTLI